jgi:hypothetical protein
MLLYEHHFSGRRQVNALSIRERLEWALIGIAIALPLFWLTYYMYMTEGSSAGIACYFTGILGVFFVRQFIFMPPTTSFRRWWNDFSTPATIGTFEGQPVLNRWMLMDFRHIYDPTGRLIATEQEIDWSATDFNWRPGDPRHIEMIITRLDGSEHLSWFARLRSPKLPVGQRAEIIDNNGVAGYTTYNKVD